MAFYHYFVNTFIFSVTQLYKYNVTVKSKTVMCMCVTTSKLRDKPMEYPISFS